MAVAARLILAAVFTAAAVAKLVDRTGNRAAVEGFGITAPIAGLVASALPALELSIAVALLVPDSARGSAIAAAGLLLLFAVAMAVNLALGRQPECRCFGELTSSKISTVSVVRNLVLAVVAMALASGALGHPDSNIFDWVGGLSAAEAGLFGLGLAVVLLGWVSVNLFLQHGRLLNRMRAVEDALRGVGLLVGSHEGLAVGTSAPDIQLSTIDGRLRKLGDYLADGRPALLVFVSSGCLPCAELLPRLGEWQRGVGADSVVIVANGTPEDYRDVAAEHGLQNVLLDEDDTVSQLFDVRGTPAAVLVDADMRIATPIAGGSDQVEALWLKLGAAEPGYSVLKQP